MSNTGRATNNVRINEKNTLKYQKVGNNERIHGVSEILCIYCTGLERRKEKAKKMNV